MATLTIELPPKEEQRAFNLRHRQELKRSKLCREFLAVVKLR